MLLSRVDQYGKLGWLTITVAAFWLAWPVGLLLVAYLMGSGRVHAWRNERTMPGTWFNLGGLGSANGKSAGGSGNHAFDDYRRQTLKDLEAEQEAFQVFLEQLRAARDKTQFDAFVERRHRRGNFEAA